MATRSTIAVVHEDGTVSQIYCHYDGYLSHNGQMLTEYYNTLLAAEFLVSKGDLSILAPRVTPTGTHSFNEPEQGVCVYYGRDRGEDNTEPRKFNSVDDYNLYYQAQEYNYLFKDGEWYFKLEVNDPQFHLVSETLEKETV